MYEIENPYFTHEITEVKKLQLSLARNRDVLMEIRYLLFTTHE
jgi:hypothetical protein